MKKGWQNLQGLSFSEAGQGCVEYAIILGFVALAVLLILFISGIIYSTLGPGLSLLINLVLLGFFAFIAAKPRVVSDFKISYVSQEHESKKSPASPKKTSSVAPKSQSNSQTVINIDTNTVQLIGVILAAFQCILAIIQLIPTW